MKNIKIYSDKSPKRTHEIIIRDLRTQTSKSFSLIATDASNEKIAKKLTEAIMYYNEHNNI